jgi:hypothetical protein
VIALVSDSNAMLPAGLRDRFSVEVVPLTIVIDGQPYAEGVEITTSTFYERLGAGATVSTAAPPPGLFLATYEQAASGWRGRGAVGAHRLEHLGDGEQRPRRRGLEPDPSRDRRYRDRVVSCGLLRLGRGRRARAGRPTRRRHAAATAVANAVGNVFIVGALDLARRGGRLAPDAGESDGVAVLALHSGTMEVLAGATTSTARSSRWSTRSAVRPPTGRWRSVSATPRRPRLPPRSPHS